MKPISVFEHNPIEPIGKPLSDTEKTALEKLRAWTGQNMFEVGWREVTATSFVGVVQFGLRTVQVLPKMHRSDLPAGECERQATANLLYLLSYTGKLLVPDMRFQTGLGETALIVDTKYKLLDPSAAKAGVTEADAYQMFAYKDRYHCPRVVLLYPKTSDTIARDFSAYPDSPPWLEVRTVDLQRDLMHEKMGLREELARVLLPAHNTEIDS